MFRLRRSNFALAGALIVTGLLLHTAPALSVVAQVPPDAVAGT
jgi:hypothetical protein